MGDYQNCSNDKCLCKRRKFKIGDRVMEEISHQIGTIVDIICKNSPTELFYVVKYDKYGKTIVNEIFLKVI